MSGRMNYSDSVAGQAVYYGIRAVRMLTGKEKKLRSDEELISTALGAVAVLMRAREMGREEFVRSIVNVMNRGGNTDYDVRELDEWFDSIRSKLSKK